MSGPRRLVVLGDTLLDRDLVGVCDRLSPEAPVPVIDDPVSRTRPGGAGLAAALAAGDGLRVTLVTALADDEPAREAVAPLARAGVEVVALPGRGATPCKVRVRAGNQSVARLDYGTHGVRPTGPLPPAGLRALAAADAVLVSDYGRGMSGHGPVRRALAALTARTPVVWDPHPRGGSPVAGARLVTPSVAEARGVGGVPGTGLADLTALGRTLLGRWRAVAVAITLGSDGALLVAGDGSPLRVPVPAAARGPGAPSDTCGAGDRFAAAAAGLLAAGALPSEAVTGAVAGASAFVAAGAASGSWSPPSAAPPGAASAADVVGRARARGGVVAATGGCFDLLHAGHVRMLQSARALGDCLVVCLNSDASVRRLKGPGRPLVSAVDRAAVLGGLACVDAVEVFDEDTPERVLARLRPDVWAKGADYAVGDLPEAPLVESWGGQAVVLPYVAGRSTTRLIEEVTRRDSG
ncbi:MAG: adenylyltransferase/cytidyltransferase family protein [Actinobacteria bacterium]|nr:adenylyltransferase/cytidyltransferase family protein [Actinomycetota bacterium]